MSPHNYALHTSFWTLLYLRRTHYLIVFPAARLHRCEPNVLPAATQWVLFFLLRLHGYDWLSWQTWLNVSVVLIFRSCIVTDGEAGSGEVAYWLRVRGCYCCWWLERILRQFGNLKLQVRMFLCELCWRVIEVLSVMWRIRNRGFHSHSSVVVTRGASNNNGRSWQKYKLYKVTFIYWISFYLFQ